jgi:hypothetical protein
MIFYPWIDSRAAGAHADTEQINGIIEPLASILQIELSTTE